MKVLFNIVQAVGILMVLFGIGAIESESIIPMFIMAAGSLLFFAGYKGEQLYVSY